VQRLADQRVGDVRPVVLGGVDVVDAQLDGAAQDGECGRAVPGRTERARAGQLHGTEADPVHVALAESEGELGREAHARVIASSGMRRSVLVW
jgi:hypothetical protein